MKKKLFAVTATLTFILLACTISFLMFPFVAETYILPQLMKELPFSTKEFSVSRISPWMIRGTLNLHDEEQQFLSIPRFEIHYSPASLLSREIDSLLLDSVTINLTVADGHLQFPDISQDVDSQPPTSEQDSNAPSLILPVPVHRVFFRNCALNIIDIDQLSITSQSYLTSGTIGLEYQRDSDDPNRLSSAAARLSVWGSATFTSEFNLDFGDETHKLSGKLQLPQLTQLAALIPIPPDYQLGGSANLEFTLNTVHFSAIDDYQLTANLARFSLKSGNTGIEAPTDEPIIIALDGNQQQAHYSIDNSLINGPLRVPISLSGGYEFKTRLLSGTGTLTPEHQEAPFSFSFQSDLAQQTSLIKYQLQADKVLFGQETYLQQFRARGDIRVDGSEWSGVMDATTSKIVSPKNEVEAKGVHFHTDFTYPEPAPALTPGNPSKTTVQKSGFFRVDSIEYKNTPSATLNLTFRQVMEGVSFSSLITTPFSDDFQIKCKGNASLSRELDFMCEVPATKVSSDKFPDYASLDETLTVNGTLAAKGNFFYRQDIFDGSITAAVSDSQLQKGDLLLSGINMRLNLPTISKIQSSPSQLCTIKTLESGKIKMSDGKFLFRIEDAQTLLLEKAELTWCGGKVEAASTTLSTGSKQLQTTLYCDRLGFTELLGQFGIEDTDGEGSLNGKLPLKFSDKGISIDNGFLFSTPGNSGIIRFNNTEQLQQGMPDIKETPYLDYTMRSLENFSYNWTKLTFNTIDDELLLAMQLDGKPEKPLPFGYKNGHIVPSDKGPGLQHPIRLDVNFRLPLEDLFQYGQNFQSILENM